MRQRMTDDHDRCLSGTSFFWACLFAGSKLLRRSSDVVRIPQGKQFRALFRVIVGGQARLRGLANLTAILDGR
jgi:hypothetical protein